jgi:hypothetical protein
MDIKTFEKLTDARFKKCKELMIGSKNVEYSRNSDKLWNFKRAGQILGCSPERALLGMYIKHLTSLFDIVDDIDKGTLPTLEILAEKNTDSIDYQVLLEALITERIQAK